MSGSKITVSRKDLPVTCPPDTEWNKHPRVCIPFPAGATESVCPYCSNRFVIREDKDKDKERG